MNDVTPEERKKICGNCKQKEDEDCEDFLETDKTYLCENGEYKLYKLRLNQSLKAKSKQYPDAKVYGNKLYFELPTHQELYVSTQAREILDNFHIDEAKFIQKLKELMKECFYDIKVESQHTTGLLWRAENISVSKAVWGWEEPDGETDQRPAHIRIDIWDIFGTERKRTSVRSEQKTRDT